MSIPQWVLDQLQRGYTYLIGLTDEVLANVIAAGIVALLGVIWAWLILRVFKRKREEKDRQVFDEMFLRRQRKAMLDVVERQWIEGRLERSLHHQASIFLGLTETPEAVERPWEYGIQTPGQARRRTRDTSDILEVFDACSSLLILGAPGSGKTVTLLDLARQLIDRARQDEDAPLPVVFVLASWAQQRKPLAEWMVAEMERQYRVPQALGGHWVGRYEVLPLLDGLDEVEESARSACAEAINAYRSGGVGGAAVAVCSREAEYVQLSTRLKVDGAVRLQLLEDEQVRRYLRRYGENTAMLARMLAENKQLRELAHTPLWLDVMTVTYRGRGTARVPDPVATGEIFDDYIHRVLLEHRQPIQEWSPEQCMHWLRWLAQQLDRTGHTLFRLEEMQPDFLGGETEQRRYRQCLRLVSATAGGVFVGGGIALIGWLVGGPDVGLTPWLALGLGFGAYFGDIASKPSSHFVPMVTNIKWDWVGALAGLVIGLLTLLFTGPMLGLCAWLSPRLAAWIGIRGSLNSWLASAPAPPLDSVLLEWLLSYFKFLSGFWSDVFGHLYFWPQSGLPVWLKYGLFSGLISDAWMYREWLGSGVSYSWSWTELNLVLYSILAITVGLVLALGLQPVNQIGQEKRPNQGSWQSARNGLVVGLVALVVVGLGTGLVFGLAIGLLIGLTSGLFLGLQFGGGTAAVWHGVLRWRLWRQGQTPRPWRYVAYLEAMTGRALLERVGGSYQFKHDLLQKHIAGLDLDHDSSAALAPVERTTKG